ncbi:GNAT family N-acetyltransferase [Paenibacillus sp. YPG26]|uniref:GNAT family N-acetyltransferase n=1 Tax=Paenibacillus sp. YPG26 TaxID=2878915 RepID=UPI00203C8DFA|nr:GNAT family N-acetyltransferase [Paenibacillus sp. YPG26]USB33923.1 GNAT family N-acetyltransferase [Paenibacillus sp. YPG26]
MQIREITEQDNQAIEQIIRRSLESFELNIPGTAYFDPQLGSLAEFYKQQINSKYWVVVTDQAEVVGGVGVGRFGQNPDICELQKLYLSPAVQGQGLSKELMRVALDYAAKHYKFCYLETFKKLQAANSLYLKFGFRQLEQGLEESEHNACDAWYMKEL